MIAPNAGLSINRQCALLGAARSSFYHRRRAEPAEELNLLARIDRIFTDHLLYGSRRLQVALGREGIAVGRRQIRRLMKISSPESGAATYGPDHPTARQYVSHRVCRAGIGPGNVR